MRAYRIAISYLEHAWRIGHHPSWYPALADRWAQRCRIAGAPPAHSTWQLPGWALHPECTALSAVFASPYWAALAVPTPDRLHRRFYENLLTELGIHGRQRLTIGDFAPLPGDIQEQARWCRLLTNPDWGAPPPVSAAPRSIPFIDFTGDHENSARKSYN